MWNGHFDVYRFVDGMIGTIRRGFEAAWLDGARNCGITQLSDLTDEERAILDREINAQFQYLPSFAFDIQDAAKVRGGKLTPLFQRTELWVNNYIRIKSMAMSMACRDKKLKWLLGFRKEHCTDCSRLAGRVYRASIWRKYNISPRMGGLACGGWKCGCRFEETTDRVTPGRPPMIGGF
jgi:hypothetical protein